MTLTEKGLTGSWSGRPEDGGQLTCVDPITDQKRQVQWDVTFFRQGKFREEVTFDYELDHRRARSVQ